MTHIPYYSPQLLPDVVGGHVSMIIYPYFALKPLIEGGKLRAVGDIGTHWIDAVSFILGSKPAAVFAMLETFHKTRRRPRGEAHRRVLRLRPRRGLGRRRGGTGAFGLGR